MKSLLCSLCTSPNFTDLSIGYGGRYALVYSFKASANRILKNSFSTG